ncbi:MAG: elongation factor G [Chloroflexi bacterium]|nr:elongation factor G [Chloroflexota bacterium]
MQVYSTEAIRNVALLSHSGAGKTSLTEAMLFATGAISRQGRVDDGTTVSDYEPEEIDRRSSIQTTLAPCEWKSVKVNVLDTPGYADFFGEVHSALAATDFAVEVISAVDGIAVGTEVTWLSAAERHLPKMIVISKLDRENADFVETLEAIRARFGKRCIAINLPQGSEASVSGVVSLLDPANEGKDPRFAGFREQLVEAAAEAVDELTEKYLDAGTLTAAELQRGIKAGINEGSLIPVVAVSAAKQVGVRELLDFFVTYAPSPKDRGPAYLGKAAGEGAKLAPEKSGPLGAFVFKTAADPYVGKLSYLRILSGTLQSDSQVWNAGKGQQERIGQLYILRGKTQDAVKELPAGDIGAVAKLVYTGTGDTLSQRTSPITLPGLDFPKPIYSVAVSPKTKADMDKMSAALAKLVDEDPSLRVSREQATGETILSGLGDAHIDVAAKKLKRKFGAEVVIATPRVPYRETISSKTVAEYKHKKQSGGHGQYGHVLLELEPAQRGQGVTFNSKVVGGSVPREYIPACEKGVMEAVQHGIIAGSPVVDIKVAVVDGSSHPVDSSGMAFQLAASQAFKKALEQARPVLLEPVMNIKVTVPDSYTGDVMGDLNSKRARVQGMNPQSGLTTIEAQAPLAEIQRYSTDLRSITQGRGYYTMEFSHYEEVPQHLAQKVAAEAKKE